MFAAAGKRYRTVLVPGSYNSWASSPRGTSIDSCQLSPADTEAPSSQAYTVRSCAKKGEEKERKGKERKGEGKVNDGTYIYCTVCSLAQGVYSMMTLRRW